MNDQDRDPGVAQWVRDGIAAKKVSAKKQRPSNHANPLQWSDIAKEIETVAMRIATSRYITTGAIADHIEANRQEYPAITAEAEWHPVDVVTYRAIVNRVNRALVKELKWPVWNRGRAPNRHGRTHIVPWRQEDPHIVRAREEVAAGIE